MKLLWSALLFFLPVQLWCGNTTVLFAPFIPEIGPFPSNAVTVPDSSQATGLRVSLPDTLTCLLAPAKTGCINKQLLNQLDGFSVNPRITVCFSGPVDVDTLRGGINLTKADGVSPSIGINQIILDPITNCVHAKPDRILDQQTQYLLTISSNVNDADGKPLKVAKEYKDCVKSDGGYCQVLTRAIHQVASGNKNSDSGEVIAATLFTTLSATNWLEKARRQVGLGIGDAGALRGGVSAFDLASVTAVTWKPDTGVSSVQYDQTLPLNVLGGVQKIAFGQYLSPLYLNTAGPQAGTISTTPTSLPIQNPNAVIPVSFHVFLPSNPGNRSLPVIIYGHGLGDNQFGAPTYVASTWAKQGFATLAIEITGHGFGPASTTQIATRSGTIAVSTPGRGIQFSPVAPIGPSDGCILPGAIATRDCSRQTAVDLMALVRAIKTNGLNLNLDASRIYYTGQSFGSLYGTLFEAVEPSVLAGTLNSGGGTQTDIARLSPIARQLGAAYLDSFGISRLNVPPAAPQAYFKDAFNDEYVYREQAITKTVPGSGLVQSAFEEADWLGMLGDPLSYAQHLRVAPLSGVPAKHILVQFALGDLEVPNPTESALVRAGGLESSTWLLRTDVVAGLNQSLLGLMQVDTPYPIYPHRFLSNPTFFGVGTPNLENEIGVAAQKQIADFFSSDRFVVSNPNQYLSGSSAGQNLFVMPVNLLPNQLNFLQIQP